MVAVLVAVGAALAVATSVGGAPDDRLAVDSDANDPEAAEDSEREPADEDVFDSEPEDSRQEHTVDEDPREDPQAPEDGPESLEPNEELTLPGDTGFVLFLRTHSGDLARIDLDTGEMVRAETTRANNTPMSVVGDSLVFEQEGAIYALGTDLEGEPELIAHNGYYALPSADGSEMWVANHSRTEAEGMEVIRVPVEGGDPTASYSLHASQVLAFYEDRVIVDLHGHISAQDPETGEGWRIGSGRVVGHADGHVAWMDCGPDLTCDLVVSNVDGEEQHRVGFEAGTHQPWFQGSLSPTGESIVAPMLSSEGQPTAAVVSAINGEATELDHGAIASNTAEWAPDASWVFVDTRRGLLAFRPSDGESALLDHGLTDDSILSIAVD